VVRQASERSQPEADARRAGAQVQDAELSSGNGNSPTASYKASLVGASPAHDMCSEDRRGLQAAAAGTCEHSRDLKVGKRSSPSATLGWIDFTTGSSQRWIVREREKGTTMTNLIQRTPRSTPATPRPLLDSAGELIGIKTPSTASGAMPASVSPWVERQGVVPQLIKTGKAVADAGHRDQCDEVGSQSQNHLDKDDHGFVMHTRSLHHLPIE